MTRRIKPNRPCIKCGNNMTVCETEGIADTWGISECVNKLCDYWEDVSMMIGHGCKVEET